MTICETIRWSLIKTDISTISGEIEDFLNGKEVVALQTFIFQGQLTVIAIFGKTE